MSRKRRPPRRAAAGPSLLWAGRAARKAHLAAEANARRLEEQLQLERDVCLSISLLASNLEKLEIQEPQLETSAYHFGRLGGKKRD